MVKFDGAKSAEPPTNSGSNEPKKSRAIWPALRVATLGSSLCCNELTQAFALALKSTGNLPEIRRSNSEANSGY